MGLLGRMRRWWTAGYRCDACGQWKSRRSGKAVVRCTLANGVETYCAACAKRRGVTFGDL